MKGIREIVDTCLTELQEQQIANLQQKERILKIRTLIQNEISKRSDFIPV